MIYFFNHLLMIKVLLLSFVGV